jgi:hypothetical protein
VRTEVGYGGPMTTEHALLAGIRTAIAATGWHSHGWGELKREAFPGPEAWLGLKAWCAENAIECEMGFGQSSKAAQVQFRRQRKSDLVAAAAAAEGDAAAPADLADVMPAKVAI